MKISQYTSLTSPQGSDELVIVDTADTSMAPTGTTKKITLANLVPGATATTAGAVQLAGDLGGTSAAPQVTGTHLAAPLPVAQGGTGTATAVPQNDVFAGPAVGGSGLPAFRALQAADLPAATTIAQGAVILDGTAADIQPSPGTQAAGAVGKTADAGHVHGQPPFLAPTTVTGAGAAARYFAATASGPPRSGTWSLGDVVPAQDGPMWLCVTAGTPGQWKQVGDQPWQFRPETYGARGDCRIVMDGTILVGSLNTLTCAGSAPFASAVPGMTVVIEGAGATLTGTSTPSAHSTTIATVVSPSQVTLTVAATTAVSGRTVAFGTDDTAAINSAVNAGAAHATAHHYYFELLLSAAAYMLAGPLIQGGASKTNSQVPLPVVPISGNPAMTMAIIGTRNNAGPPMFAAGGDTPMTMANGTVLVSSLTGCVYSGLLGQPAVIGGPTSEQGYTGAFTNLWNNLVLVVDGVTVLVPPIASLSGIDNTSGAQTEFKAARASAMAPASVLAGPNYNPHWSNAGSFPKGLVTSQGGNNAHVHAGILTVYGFAVGVELYEQSVVTELVTILCGIGLDVNGSAAGHDITILKWSAEANNTHLSVEPGNAIGINIVSMNAENVSQWTAGHHVDDPTNLLHGRIGLNTSQGVGTISINGGASLEVIYDYISATAGVASRGFAGTQPAVPASGTPVANPNGKHATVYITSGGAAVTAISIIDAAGTIVTGLTLGTTGTVMVRVPAQSSISWTGTTAPTWKWQYD